MRLSVFNLYVEEYPEPGQTLVYNTFSGGFASFDRQTLDVLHKADTGAALDAAEQELIDPDLFDENVGIMVESRSVEEQAFRSWFHKQRSGADMVRSIVSITFACNLDCSYCCQADILNGTMMKANVGADTARWLADRALAVGARSVHLDIVGGEPLLHPHRIEQIVADIRARGLDVTFFLITNGMFLTRELVERWVPLGLTGAQVTLDGDETTHSITRRSKKKGEDSFATIFKNVVDVADLIRITINGNYQEDTVHGFVPLLTKLREAGLKRGTRVSFTPALAALGAPTDSAAGSCTWSGSSPELMIALGDQIRRHGFDAQDPATPGPCGFYQKQYFAIDPQGHIYKCPGFLGKPEWNIGHVSTGLTDRYDGLVNSNPVRLCGSCAHRPNCAGGCVAAQWLKIGRMEGVNCEISLYTRFNDDIVKRRYAIATSETPEAAAAQFPEIDLSARRGKHVPALRVIAA